MSSNDALAQRVVAVALERKRTLVTVESCTAGALAYTLSRAEGASQALHDGFVVYTKANKATAVGVPWELLQTETAVSAPVAHAMARGGLDRSPADIALAVTGVAGPEPDEDGNPVGLVFVAGAMREGHAELVTLHLSGSADEICEQAVTAALGLALRLMGTEQG